MSTYDIQAFDKGMYTHEGFSRNRNEGYLLRWEDAETPQERYRSFFAFDLSTIALNIDDTVDSAVLRLEMPARGFRSPNAFEGMFVHQIPADFVESVLQGGQQPVAVFDALAAEPKLGETRVSNDSDGSIVEIELNVQARSILAATLGNISRRLLFGSRINPIGPAAGERSLFRLTDENSSVELRIVIDEF